MSGIPSLKKKVLGMLEERIALLQEGIFDGGISVTSAQKLEQEIDTLFGKYTLVAGELAFQYQTWGQVDQNAKLSAELDKMYRRMDMIRASVGHYCSALEQGVFDTKQLEDSLKEITVVASTQDISRKLLSPAPAMSQTQVADARVGDTSGPSSQTEVLQGYTEMEKRKENTGIREAEHSRARNNAQSEEKEQLGLLLVEAEKTYQDIKTRLEALGEQPVTEEDVLANMYAIPQQQKLQQTAATGGVSKQPFIPSVMSTPRRARLDLGQDSGKLVHLKSDQEIEGDEHVEYICDQQEPTYLKYTTPAENPYGGEQYKKERRIRILKKEEKPAADLQVDPSNDGRAIGLDLKKEEKLVDNPRVDLSHDGSDSFLAVQTGARSKEQNAANVTFGYSDVPKHLKNIPLKKFSGNKRQFETWWSAFMACVDAPVHIRDEVKMLKLLDMVEGEALEAVENLGVSASAYAVAKRHLTRKFRGKQRQLNIHWTDLLEFKQIKDDSSVDVEKLAETLDRLVVYLQDNNESHELGGGTLYSMILRKLNRTMSTNYQRWLHEKGEKGTVLSLYEFINKEAEFMVNAVESIQGLGTSTTKKKKETGKTFTGSAKIAGPVKPPEKKFDRKCLFSCPDSHGLWGCKKFQALDINQRWDKVKEFKVCFKCLQEGHQQEACRRGRPCGVSGCKLSHNRLLHNPDARSGKKMETSQDSKIPAQVSSSPLNSIAIQTTPSAPSQSTILEGLSENTEVKGSAHTYHSAGGSSDANIAYRTVPVILQSGQTSIKVVALLDDSSNKSYISDRVANHLQLKGVFTKLHVNVVGDRIEKFSSQHVGCTLLSVDGNVKKDFWAYTVKNVAAELKVVNFNRLKYMWSHLRDIVFPSIPSSHVDILIGLEYVSLMSSVCPDIIGKEGEPIARLTPLGWTCVGLVKNTETFTFHGAARSETEILLKRFWEIENTENAISMSKEDALAMKKVKDSIKYINGRYQVSLPWKDERPESLNNYYKALKRWKQLDRKFKKNPVLGRSYREVFYEYSGEDIIREIKIADPWNFKGHFLSHFPVIREHVATTKVRPVMDASDEEDGVSLNDLLLCGPALQQSLPKVLCRFRRFQNAFITDIEKMYMQILVDPEDWPFQCFLLGDEGDDGPPRIYCFTRVVFGMNCSPFLAQYVARYNAALFIDRFPRAVDVILNSTYMDDSQDSFRSVSQSIEVSREVTQIWNHAGMNPRKWLSNSEELLATFPSSELAKSVDLLSHELPKVKTLGMNWYPKEDVLRYLVNMVDQLVPMTKRKYLKVLATVYDPLGLACPVTVVGRILLQRVWEKGYDWDEEIAPSLAEKMQDWIDDMVHLAELIINRVLFPEAIYNVKEIQLHGFADSSIEAYGGVVYVRVEKVDGRIASRLVMARVKVTPLRAITMPKLELMAALITARLLKAAMIFLQLSMSDVRCFLWTDSMDCLFWIYSTSKYLKPFVGHRVAEIQSLFPPETWQHVGTAQNPADVLSRGIPAARLQTCTIWWNGPEFLQHPEKDWPKVDIHREQDMMSTSITRKKTKSASFHSHISRGYHDVKVSELLDIKKFSSWTRLVNMMARLHLVVEIWKKNRTSRVLTADDVTWAAVVLLRDHQLRMYPQEMKVLETKKGSVLSSELAGMNPWLDMEGLMRSHTRLAESTLVPWHVKFPVLLAPKDHISQLIVRYYHNEAKHGGTGLTLSLMTQRFWMVYGREEIRRWEKLCMVCIRANKAPVRVKMAPLPGYRTERVAVPFQNTSIDYAGPFLTMQGRGKARLKRYLCLFTCLSVRAVHLEIVWSCTTDAFLLAFNRFTDRRGRPEKVFTDNGPNLVGGATVIHELRASLNTDRIQEKTASKEIRWHFQPPLAPHFSGVHEVMVKSAKRAIYQALHAADYTDEELISVTSCVENLMNERPLTYQTANPADHIPLCPNNFIVGRMNVSMSPEAAGKSSSSLISRWRYVQDLVDIYWYRWIAEWISSLSPRKKWRAIGEEVQEGDVALLLDPNIPRGSWIMGRIEKTYPGSDGHVRVVDLKTKNGIFKRPVVRICKLC